MSYFEFAKRSERVYLIYYEDLVANPEGLIRDLSSHCEVSEDIIIPQSSTKGDVLTFSDYKSEAMSYKPNEALGLQAYENIKERLNQLVMKQTIYSND